MRTRDLDEAIEAVTRVYCPHTIEITGRARNVDVVLEVSRPTSQPLVELSYGVPVKIDAGDFPRLFLMMHCAQGRASTTQDNESAEWRRGQTIPFSAGLHTQLRFDQLFVQKSVRLDVDKLETLCARWLGHPLEAPLRFALRPFSEEFEPMWERTLSYMWLWDEIGLGLTPPTKAALDEFLLTLLLHHHEHNFSEEIAETEPTPVPGLVRRAERYIADHAATAITASDVAAHLGVSIRTLQSGFRHWRSTTPNLYLRNIRLQLARDELLRLDGKGNVTNVAMRYGFLHLGRFSAQYQAAFGELPSSTLRRKRSMSNRRNKL